MKRITVLALAALAVLGACSKPKAPETGGLTPVRFATDWKAEAEHGGFYEALATGEYKKRGLDVKIIPGGPGSNVPQLLSAGAADMGVGSNAFGVMNLAKEKVPVKAVMAVFQKDPQVLMAHPDSGVNGLADLKGHPILLADSAVTSLWLWLKAKYALDDRQIRKYTFNPGPFLADQRAVQEGYVTSEPYTIEKQAHLKPKVFLLADSGYPGYATMVLVPDALIAKDPKTVQAFVDATREGWKQYLYGDPKPADALILKDNPEMTQDVLDQARDKLRAYQLAAASKDKAGDIGQMSDARWAAFMDMAKSVGVYPKTMDPKGAYTLQFLGGK